MSQRLRLTVLGGAAAWPNPGQGCSAYLARYGDTVLLLDCGPDTLHELRRHIDAFGVTAAVISHMHADHILDLVPWRYGLVYGPASPPAPVPLWLPPGGCQRLDRLGAAFAGQGERTDAFWDDVFERHEYDPESQLVVGDLTIRFALTQHFIPCYAIRVNAPGGSLFYSADTGSIDGIVDLARGCDVVVVEATLEVHEASPDQRGHLTPEDAGLLAAAAGARTLVLTHLWVERPDEVVVREARRAFDGEIVVAKPGVTLDA